MLKSIIADYRVAPQIVLTKSRFLEDLSSSEILFFAELREMSKSSIKYHYCIEDFAHFFGVRTQTIINWMKKLKKLELIELTPYDEERPSKKYFKTTR